MKTVATAIALATAAFTLTPAVAHADDPTRVLIVGDSVTHGLDGNHTWRYYAWQTLQGAGASVDFVGPRTGTHLDAARMWGGSYADANFDTDHAARWGMAMAEMLNAPDENSPSIETLVAASQPDIIVEQLGVNDFDRVGLTAEEMTAQVTKFVADARSVNPGVDVVLGSIPQTWIRDVVTYNSVLPGLAASLSTDASRVVATPVASFTRGVETYDFAHPTDSGQVKLAESVTDALSALGIPTKLLPEPTAPEITQPATPPTSVGSPTPTLAPPAAPKKVRAHRDGRKAQVRWSGEKSADRYTLRCGKSRKVVSRTKAKVRSQAARCRVRSVNEAGASRWVKVRVLGR